MILYSTAFAEAADTAQTEELVFGDITGQETLQAAATEAPAEAKAGFNPLPVLLIAAVIIVILLVLLLKKKQKKPKSQPQPQPGRPGTGQETVIAADVLDPNKTTVALQDNNRTEISLPDGDTGPYEIGYAQIQGTRDNQEDSYGVSTYCDGSTGETNELLAVVADGIGGIEGGELASSQATRAMFRAFQNDAKRSMSDRLLAAAGEAQRAVLTLCHNGKRCGTTLISAYLHEKRMVFLSIGDSRIYLYRKGALLQINREHVLGNTKDIQTFVNKAGYFSDNRKRKSLTSYVGMENLQEIDRCTTPQSVLPGDRIILMSDGVFGVIPEDDIAAAQSKPPKEAAGEILRKVQAMHNPSQDNATVVIVEISK